MRDITLINILLRSSALNIASPLYIDSEGTAHFIESYRKW